MYLYTLLYSNPALRSAYPFNHQRNWPNFSLSAKEDFPFGCGQSRKENKNTTAVKSLIPFTYLHHPVRFQVSPFAFVMVNIVVLALDNIIRIRKRGLWRRDYNQFSIVCWARGKTYPFHSKIEWLCWLGQSCKQTAIQKKKASVWSTEQIWLCPNVQTVTQPSEYIHEMQNTLRKKMFGHFDLF